MPAPPPEVDITVPEPIPGSTTKELFAQHSEDPACSGCHRLMDPLGFGFENYDAIGRWRTEEEVPGKENFPAVNAACWKSAVH